MLNVTVVIVLKTWPPIVCHSSGLFLLISFCHFILSFQLLAFFSFQDHVCLMTVSLFLFCLFVSLFILCLSLCHLFFICLSLILCVYVSYCLFLCLCLSAIFLFIILLPKSSHRQQLLWSMDQSSHWQDNSTSCSCQSSWQPNRSWWTRTLLHRHLHPSASQEMPWFQTTVNSCSTRPQISKRLDVMSCRRALWMRLTEQLMRPTLQWLLCSQSHPGWS